MQLINHIIKEIDIEIGTKKDRLSDGGCKNFADYRRDSGFIKGMARAKEIIQSEHNKRMGDMN